MYLLVNFYQESDQKIKDKKNREKDIKFMLESFNKIVALDSEESKE